MVFIGVIVYAVLGAAVSVGLGTAAYYFYAAQTTWYSWFPLHAVCIGCAGAVVGALAGTAQAVTDAVRKAAARPHP